MKNEMSNLIQIESEVIFQTYKRLPIVVERAEGARIWDINGNEYLDFLAGIAVNSLGHGHKRILEAVNKQISQYMHLSNYFYQEPQIKLAKKLVEMTGFSRVFFSNSGAEAMEGAIKLIRRYFHNSERTEIVALTGGFHGRTYGALSLMAQENYKSQMGPFLAGTKVIEHNSIAALESEINEKTMAVVLEFFQGEGGIVSPTVEYVNKLVELKEKYGFLLVADEIQTGAGRTGKFFGFEHFDVLPDIVTMAKGLGGGLPLGAILAKDFLANVWGKGNHGTTFGGNAVACAAGLAVLEELEDGLMDKVVEIGKLLKDELLNLMNKFPEKIIEVRGTGLMLGLLLSFDAAILLNELLNEKVIANATSSCVLRIVPPLIITKQEVDEFISKLEIALSRI